jgi:AcrR family transcriptional regulator
MRKAVKQRDESRSGTREKLARAAAAEFRVRGFGGTDTNRIARRAGFAPQTFYRWFADKIEIFLFVYRAWEEEEAKTIGALVERRARAEEMADAIVAHHRAHLLFRRSLRQLSVENPQVRTARTESRLRQLARMEQWNTERRRSRDELAPLLLQIERLSDAIAEDEFDDLGISPAAARTALAEVLRRLR